MAYNYLDAVKDDVRQVIEDEYVLSDYPDRDAFEEELCDVLWADDSVTGNGSGSYTYDREQAKEYLFDSTDGEDWLVEAFSEVLDELYGG